MRKTYLRPKKLLHTHRWVIGEVIPGFMGVNVGSDYDDLKTFTLEV